MQPGRWCCNQNRHSGAGGLDYFAIKKMKRDNGAGPIRTKRTGQVMAKRGCLRKKDNRPCSSEYGLAITLPNELDNRRKTSTVNAVGAR